MAEKVSTKQMKPVGAGLSMTLDNTTFVLTIQLKDQSGNNLGEAKTVDLTDVVKGSGLSDLSDVQISSAEGGQVMMYDAVLGKWKNATSTASIGFDGITGNPYDNANLKTALDAKAGAATTIAGYNITDAYTKSEVNTAIGQKISCVLRRW